MPTDSTDRTGLPLLTLQAAAGASGDASSLQQQRVLVQYLSDSHLFARHVGEVIVVAAQLLGSTAASDVREAVEFFVTASEFHVASALTGVRKMLSLM